MARKPKDAPAEGFEDHLSRLEELVGELESGTLTLDASLQRYEEGVRRLKQCYETLRKAEEQVKVLVRDAEGALGERPADEEDA